MSATRADASPRRPAPGACGFTLIELMIVIVVIAILASIAIPAYTQYVDRARRADGQDALQNVAQRLERCFSQYGEYDDTDNCSVADTLDGGSIDSPEAYYSITAATLDSTSFELEAAPQNEQTGDDCGTFELEHTGAKDVDGGSLSADECWR